MSRLAGSVGSATHLSVVVDHVPDHVLWSDWPSVVTSGRVDWRRFAECVAPHDGVSPEVQVWRRGNLRNVLAGAWRVSRPRRGRGPLTGALYCDVVRGSGEHLPLGLVSLDVVTTAGVNFLVDAWQNSVELEIMKYHGVGTNSTSPVIGDTALGAESTTALNPDNTRGTGTLTEGASANVFRTVGTLTADASIAMTEWGLFSQAATGGGTMFDRATFNVVNLVASDTVTWTFDCTFAAGS